MPLRLAGPIVLVQCKHWLISGGPGGLPTGRALNLSLLRPSGACLQCGNSLCRALRSHYDDMGVSTVSMHAPVSVSVRELELC